MATSRRTENNTLTVANLPAHGHPLRTSTSSGTSPNPAGASLAAYGTTVPPFGPYSASAPDTTLKDGSVGSSGGGQRVNNIQPYLSVNFIIALEGVYPSRS